MVNYHPNETDAIGALVYLQFVVTCSFVLTSQYT